jgi:hypothetical protein
MLICGIDPFMKRDELRSFIRLLLPEVCLVFSIHSGVFPVRSNTIRHLLAACAKA